MHGNVTDQLTGTTIVSYLILNSIYNSAPEYDMPFNQFFCHFSLEMVAILAVMAAKSRRCLSEYYFSNNITDGELRTRKCETHS